MINIAVSTNPENENKVLKYALLCQKSGADYLHVDIMDGKFVDNVALSLDKAKELSFGCLLPIDVHLMVDDIKTSVSQYVNIRPNYITVHIEKLQSMDDFMEVRNYLSSHEILMGISIKPDTDIDKVVPYLPYVNLVMPMSVEPGKSGQKFIESVLDKFSFLDDYRKQHNLNFKIQADGGVNADNIEKLSKVGVDIAVVGSALYKAPNKKVYIDKLKSLSQ